MLIGNRTVWLFSVALLAGSTAAEATQVAAFNPVASGNNNFTFLLPRRVVPGQRLRGRRRQRRGIQLGRDGIHLQR